MMEAPSQQITLQQTLGDSFRAKFIYIVSDELYIGPCRRLIDLGSRTAKK